MRRRPGQRGRAGCQREGRSVLQGLGGGRGAKLKSPSPALAVPLLGCGRLGILVRRCSNAATAGAPGGRAFLRGEMLPLRWGALPRGCVAVRRREHWLLWFLGLSIRKRTLPSVFSATLVPRKGAVLLFEL